MSGAGTNIGIEYQNKVASWFTLQMFCETDVCKLLSLDNFQIKPKIIKFEASDPIDDLIVTSINESIYIQVKHNLSLSIKDNSDFYSVINQFVKQYKLNKDNSVYLLITTSKSSNSIIYDLSKILNSIRYNRSAWKQNPLNKKEKEILSKYKECMIEIGKNYGGITDKEFEEISSKIHISKFDIEKNEIYENATLMQITSITNFDPNLVWANLIKYSNEMASKRQSIDKEGLNSLFSPYIQKNMNLHEIEKQNPGEFDIIYKEGSQGYLSGVDYILGSIEKDKKHQLVVTQFYRFDNNGKLRLYYKKGYLKFDNGLIIKVLFRCSTITRLENYLKENMPTEQLYFLQSNFDPAIKNNSVYAKSWSKKLENSMPKHISEIVCYHCAEFISEKDISIIENNDLINPKIAFIHKNCRQGTDRVIGHIEFPFFKEKTWLEHTDFNIEGWIQAYIKSANVINQTSVIQGSTVIVAWDNNYTKPNGKYCYRYTLSDSGIEYVHKRTLIDRDNELDAKSELLKLKQLIEKNKQNNDPLCVNSVTRQFGNYSKMLAFQKEGEELLDIIDVEIDSYSLPIEKTYQILENFYAPVCFLREKKSGIDFTLGQHFIIISNPLNLNKYLKNWQKFAGDIPKMKLVTITSDDEFDLLLKNKIAKGYTILANPLIDKNCNIVSCVQIKPLSSL